MTVLVRGSVSYDKYFRDYAIRPLSIMSVQKEKKMDDAPVKRVELHLHTKMSAMDGISDCSALIKRAAEWGIRLLQSRITALRRRSRRR